MVSKVQTFLAYLYFLYHREAILSARCVLGPPALLPSQGPPRGAIPHVLSVCEAAGPVDGGGCSVSPGVHVALDTYSSGNRVPERRPEGRVEPRQAMGLPA